MNDCELMEDWGQKSHSIMATVTVNNPDRAQVQWTEKLAAAEVSALNKSIPFHYCIQASVYKVLRYRLMQITEKERERENNSFFS